MLKIISGPESNLVIADASEIEISNDYGNKINKGKFTKKKNRKMAESKNLIKPNHNFSLNSKNKKNSNRFSFFTSKARLVIIKLK